MHTLFVCTGNICRSPIAERLASAGAAQARIRDFTASSAGVQALVGHPVHRHAVPVIESLGGNASNFAARRLSPQIASAADLILTMTRTQRDAVLALAPQRLRMTFSLGEAALLASDHRLTSVSEMAAMRPRLAAGRVPDVPDPIGRDADFFETVGAQIAELLQPVLKFCEDIANS
ncbi:protein tyrosine phosphatase [Mycolicibacterium confluentis]|nr:low molecular weight phosphatase family protein [Mycolicibacterium confluentis]MCV7319871.1 low molecular weight phosphatase family protein [Mycolicibacterium confluentis]ORV34885.1 protein tyrosine phosphatase [Mycolicibacterium confluentis]